MNQPLVTVVCLSHNHNEFVEESIQSVLDQKYENIELIVVDDGSTDGTKTTIESLLGGMSVKFISIESSIGNCKAFNHGFAASTGQFIIDLAADDILMPNRISEGLETFSSKNIGVNFCDAFLIDRNGKHLGTHYKRASTGRLIQNVEEGDIYKTLIEKYFISAPTMMIKREVLEDLGGYDENLTYEDFDFWIRSSRKWNYGFTDKILVKKRMLKSSLGNIQFELFSKHQKSTLEVCRKIKKLNKSRDEDAALQKRCWYEIRQCLRQSNLRLIWPFLMLLRARDTS